VRVGRGRGRERDSERDAYSLSNMYYYSDYIRMLLLSQYGGWYSNLERERRGERERGREG
jgi:hypothetical protein